MIEQCIAEISRQIAIPKASADLYAAAMERMIDQVNRELAGRSDVKELIGNNPLQMMEMNHQYHARFMLTVFRLNNYDLLVRTVPWVYRAYHSRGFSYDYFPIELLSWKSAVTNCIGESEAAPILGFPCRMKPTRCSRYLLLSCCTATTKVASSWLSNQLQRLQV
jgi:hypothetical protein